jgi:predicted transcriptional regulator of viral defense system
MDQALRARRARTQRANEPLLAYYVAAGRVARVRRGLYYVVPVGSDPRTFPPDPFLLAGKMAPDCVLAYHTALQFHGKAYSVRRQFTYLTRSRPRPVRFREYEFRAVGHPKALKAARKENFGVADTERSGLRIRITGLERTLVDVLDRPQLSGSWEEIWRSLESIEFVDIDQVVEYTLMLRNATTAAKVGFFLEQHRTPLMLEDSHLKALRKARPRKPHYLERTRRTPGRLVSEWNLVVPQSILDRAWEEVR